MLFSTQQLSLPLEYSKTIEVPYIPGYIYAVFCSQNDNEVMFIERHYRKIIFFFFLKVHTVNMYRRIPHFLAKMPNKIHLFEIKVLFFFLLNIIQSN